MNFNHKQLTEYVYCMTNKSFNPNIVKIGWTTNDPYIRAQQLYTTGVPTPFTIEFIIKTYDGRALETRIHTHLARLRESTSREFFNISVQELRNVLTNTLHLILTLPEPIITHERNTSTHQPTNMRFERCSKQIMQIYQKTSCSRQNITQSQITSATNTNTDNIFEMFQYTP